MSNVNKDANIVEPVDAQIGGDADFPGISQTMTLDDIKAVTFSQQPLETRRQQLKQMQEEISARQSADGGGDMDVLAVELERALALLEEPIGEIASRGALGMTPDKRLDTQSPDEREQ